MPYLDPIPYEQMAGEMRRVYAMQMRERGRISGIRGVMCREPMTVEGMYFFNPETNYRCSSVDRRLGEMIAVVASIANGSRFGAPVHAAFLARVVGGNELPAALLRDYRNAGLPRREVALLDYVKKLTTTPASMTRADIEDLRAAGWTDAQITATVHITGFFNYMNRVAEAFGLDPEPDFPEKKR